MSTGLRSCLLQTVLDLFAMGHVPHIPIDFFHAEAETSPFFFNSVCALGAMYIANSLLEGHDRMDLSEMFYTNACSGLAIGLEQQTNGTLLALISLFIYCREAQKGKSAMGYRQMMVSIAMEMKVNTIPPLTEDQKTHENQCIGVNLWWFVYKFDRLTACLVGQPSIIKNSDCAVYLPVNVEDFDLEKFSLTFEKRKTQVNIMSASLDYIPIPEDLCCPVAYIILLKIYCDICEFIKGYKQSNEPPEKKEFQKFCLAQSIQEWRRCTPSYTQGGRMYRLGLWEDQFFLLTYSSAMITLYRDAAFEQGDQQAKGICWQMTESVAGSLHLFLSHNPSFYGVPRYVSHSIYTAAMVCSLILQSPNEIQLFEPAKAHILLCKSALEHLAPFSIPCKLHYKKLIDVLADIPAVSPTTYQSPAAYQSPLSNASPLASPQTELGTYFSKFAINKV